MDPRALRAVNGGEWGEHRLLGFEAALRREHVRQSLTFGVRLPRGTHVSFKESPAGCLPDHTALVNSELGTLQANNMSSCSPWPSLVPRPRHSFILAAKAPQPPLGPVITYLHCVSAFCVLRPAFCVLRLCRLTLLPIRARSPPLTQSASASPRAPRHVHHPRLVWL